MIISTNVKSPYTQINALCGSSKVRSQSLRVANWFRKSLFPWTGVFVEMKTSNAISPRSMCCKGEWIFKTMKLENAISHNAVELRPGIEIHDAVLFTKECKQQRKLKDKINFLVSYEWKRPQAQADKTFLFLMSSRSASLAPPVGIPVHRSFLARWTRYFM